MAETIDARILPVIDILYDEDFNCRGTISPPSVVDLARDIEERGLVQPVTVAPLPPNHPSGKHFRLIAGFRRYMAHIILKRDTIQSIVRADMMNEDEAFYFNLAENIQRTELDIIQESKAVMKLVAHGKTRKEIAQKLGMSDGWVQIRMSLCELPIEIQELAAAKVITQPQIRELYTTYKYVGKEKCLEQAKMIHDAKIRGKKAIVESVKPNTKRARGKAEINQYLDYAMEFIPGGFWSRCLAWTSGEITDEDLEESCKEYCQKVGVEYKDKPKAV